MTGSDTQSVGDIRDLGGLAASHGRRIRHGLLYRSGALQPGSTQRATVGALGLKLICDLRSSTERLARPCFEDLDPPPRRLLLDLSAVLETGAAPVMQRLRREPGVAAAEALMRRTYELLPVACASRLGELFLALNRGELPVLIHCTAGKDRTGFVIAMLLTALDVPRESVYADYLVDFGSVDAYLRRAAQLAPEARQQLQAVLLA